MAAKKKAREARLEAKREMREAQEGIFQPEDSATEAAETETQEETKETDK